MSLWHTTDTCPTVGAGDENAFWLLTTIFFSKENIYAKTTAFSR